ncbi:chromosome partitioning protein ParA [Vibrio mangrovi]|uniref:Chromosome partitioning protein ParA n=1 Tax=Vibrio mangrovi TaxID=474394 RepID=A0A1Y6IN95_9VIBR|nr:chromosome partitioning protein ParA [Vibrio mangrovi]MDW6004067.1 chromosome partitioning protein ParA [Vibrio mangrovi]SMR99135.1 Ribonuclease Y [Vibrio mangrovi]
MNKQSDGLDDEDVVVIEQRDKKTYIYIGIAAVIGIAAGGLLGGILSGQRWEQAYQSLESRYHQLEQANQKTLVTSDQQTRAQIQQLTKEFDQKLAEEKSHYQQQVDELNAQIATLTQEKSALDKQLSDQQSQMSQVNERNNRLNRQADLQASLFERSRELFQKELKVKQSLESLEKEKETLQQKIKALKKECDLYLEGTSWDAHSDACDQQDEANGRLGKVNQLIRVNQMDLKEIQSLAKELGVE